MPDEAVMIRARASTRDSLRELAELEGTTLIETLDRLVAKAREEFLVASVAKTLDGHVHAIAAETAVLDLLAADGLDADDDFSDW